MNLNLILAVMIDDFENIFMNVLDKYAPIKLKYLRANDGPFMNKKLRRGNVEVQIKKYL